jgi:hypothetical protein
LDVFFGSFREEEKAGIGRRVGQGDEGSSPAYVIWAEDEVAAAGRVREHMVSLAFSSLGMEKYEM